MPSRPRSQQRDAAGIPFHSVRDLPASLEDSANRLAEPLSDLNTKLEPYESGTSHVSAQQLGDLVQAIGAVTAVLEPGVLHRPYALRRLSEATDKRMNPPSVVDAAASFLGEAVRASRPFNVAFNQLRSIQVGFRRHLDRSDDFSLSQRDIRASLQRIARIAKVIGTGADLIPDRAGSIRQREQELISTVVIADRQRHEAEVIDDIRGILNAAMRTFSGFASRMPSERRVVGRLRDTAFNVPDFGPLVLVLKQGLDTAGEVTSSSPAESTAEIAAAMYERYGGKTKHVLTRTISTLEMLSEKLPQQSQCLSELGSINVTDVEDIANGARHILEMFEFQTPNPVNCLDGIAGVVQRVADEPSMAGALGQSICAHLNDALALLEIRTHLHDLTLRIEECFDRMEQVRPKNLDPELDEGRHDVHLAI